MAKVVNHQKHGSVGPSTFQGSPHGTIERLRVKPRNPRTPRQQTHRRLVASISSQWRALTEVQRAGWTALAGQLRGNPSGQQVFMRVNVPLVEADLPTLGTAPSVPVFGTLSCAGLLLEDPPRVRLLQVADTVKADKFLVDACPPVQAGVQYVKNLFRRFAVVDAHATPAADLDLTAAYIQRFGKPEVGLRVVVRLAAMTNGFRGPSLQVGGLVAARGAEQALQR